MSLALYETFVPGDTRFVHGHDEFWESISIELPSGYPKIELNNTLYTFIWRIAKLYDTITTIKNDKIRMNQVVDHTKR